jgi:hypothetical protein
MTARPRRRDAAASTVLSERNQLKRLEVSRPKVGRSLRPPGLPIAIRCVEVGAQPSSHFYDVRLCNGRRSRGWPSGIGTNWRWPSRIGAGRRPPRIGDRLLTRGLLSGASQRLNGDGRRVVPDLRRRADRKELPVEAEIAAVTSMASGPPHVSRARQQVGEPVRHVDCGVVPGLKMGMIIDRAHEIDRRQCPPGEANPRIASLLG